MAEDFRNGIKNLPLEIISESPSNAVTALHPTNTSAREIVRILKDEYHIWVCPNGGDMADLVFRVGHLGYIGKEDNHKLIGALHSMNKRKLL